MNGKFDPREVLNDKKTRIFSISHNPSWLFTACPSIFLAVLCRVMGVKRSPYYDWKARGGKVVGLQKLELRRRMKA